MEKIVTIYTCENCDNIVYIIQLHLFKKITLRTHITNQILLVICCNVFYVYFFVVKTTLRTHFTNHILLVIHCYMSQLPIQGNPIVKEICY